MYPNQKPLKSALKSNKRKSNNPSAPHPPRSKNQKQPYDDCEGLKYYAPELSNTVNQNSEILFIDHPVPEKSFGCICFAPGTKGAPNNSAAQRTYYNRFQLPSKRLMLQLLSHPFTGSLMIFSAILLVTGIVMLVLAIGYPQTLGLLIGISASTLFALKIAGGFSCGLGMATPMGLMFFRRAPTPTAHPPTQLKKTASSIKFLPSASTKADPEEEEQEFNIPPARPPTPETVEAPSQNVTAEFDSSLIYQP